MDTGAAALMWTISLIGLVIGTFFSVQVGTMIGLGSFFLGMSLCLSASVISDSIEKLNTK